METFSSILTRSRKWIKKLKYLDKSWGWQEIELDKTLFEYQGFELTISKVKSLFK